MLTRRDMISMAGQAALAAAVTRPCAAGAAAQPAAPSRRPTFCMFPKPLPELGWRALGGVVRDAGFEGVDLTVRARGHVLPERATEDLPRAVEAISASGLCRCR
jgi:L-ribulose-5-phosphate 3-epimerase